MGCNPTRHGGGGKLAKKSTPKNSYRDLRRALGWPKNAPEYTWLEYRGAKGDNVVPVVCPIAYIESLVENDPTEFRNRFLGDDGDVRAFWEGLEGHVVKEAIADKVNVDTTIGLGFHGDSAPTTKTEGLLTIAWNSTTGKGSTKDTRNVFAVVPKSAIESGLLLAIWDYMAWAFNALLEGRMPERDHRGVRHPQAGRRLARGWTFAMVQLRGDWEFYSEYLGLPRWDGKTHMCWLCYAQQGRTECADNLKWLNDGAGEGGWRARRRTHEEFIAELLAAGKPIPGPFRIVSLRLEGVMADVLHALDQGVASHLVGNAWWELQEVFGASTQSRRIALLEADCKRWHREKGLEYTLQGKLTVERVRTSAEWPKLKAKGAATRHLLDYTVHLAATHNGGSRHDMNRLAACQLLQTFYKTCESEGRYLSGDARRTIAPLARRFMGVYRQLSAEALAQKKRAWKMTPKFHMFEEICAYQV